MFHKEQQLVLKHKLGLELEHCFKKNVLLLILSYFCIAYVSVTIVSIVKE
ncbi:hypothetical protein [Paenibacillus agri]|uniref:Uncharacterized protein n=1 Tax=Paenibacillus agri TaxID=2744309 RepID=A0A850EJH9_9BACL|nr:hypothetical protein [Paenibacillus agri]NUU59587.1 hypothetical protein [Paenibacillus agri]